MIDSYYKKLRLPKKLFIVLTGTLWLLIQLFQYLKFGIITSDEAAKYLREADRLLSGEELTSNQYVLYGTYILFIASCKWLHLNVTAIYLLQTLFSGLSLIAFYRLIQLVVKSETSARIGVVLLILCITYQSWNTHLYTESFFLSLQLIFLFSYFRSGIKNSTTLLLLPLLLFARPTGILVIIAVLIHAGFKVIQEKKPAPKILLSGAILIFLLVLVVNSFLSIGGSFDFKKPFIQAHIICDVPQDINFTPDTIGIKNPNSLQGIATLIAKNPVFFAKLFVERTKAYFGLTRTYYSQGHNLFLKVYFYPLYLFSFIAIIQLLKRNKAIAIFAIAFIGLFYGSVLLSCDDWLNRFFMPVIPILILLSVNLNQRKNTLAH